MTMALDQLPADASAAEQDAAATMRRRPLFRAEAVEAFRYRQWGQVAPLQPLSTCLLFLAVVVATMLIAIFLWQAEYARKETVAGYLAPSAGVVRVFAPRPGTIRAVEVEEGQQVAVGQPLFTVAVDQTTADGVNVDDTVLQALTGQKALLAERIATQETLAVFERQRLESQIDGIEGEIAQLEAQVAAQKERVTLLGDRAASFDELRARGVLSKADQEVRREAYLQQKQYLGSLQQALVARRSDLAAARGTLAQLPTVTAQKIQLLRNDLLEAEQHIAEIEGRRGYVVRASTAGRVSTLQAAAGRLADPRQPQLAILPSDSVLQAELFVPTRAAGFVHPGQEVRILYDAFPYQRFGTHRGRIVMISRSVLLETDVSAPVTIREPVYKAVVALERQDIVADGRSTPLQVDMLLKADIVLEKRPLIVWVLDPLLRARVS
jgi:membrane fusion protein